MARYFLHLRDSGDELLAPDGREFVDMASLKRAVLTSARDLMAGDICNGVLDLRYWIDAEDQQGKIVDTLAFSNAFTLIPEDDEVREHLRG